MKTAVEDLRHAMIKNSLARLVREGNDDIDQFTSALFDTSTDDTSHRHAPSHSDDISRQYHDIIEYLFTHSDSSSPARPVDTFDLQYTSEQSSVIPNQGDEEEMYWPLDNVFDTGTGGDVGNGYHTSNYDGEHTETIDVDEQTRRFECSAVLNAVSPYSLRLPCDLSTVYDAMILYFGNKPLLRDETQDLPSYALQDSYNLEDAYFKKTVECGSLANIPFDTKIICSHVLSKMKVQDDETLELKVQIAPHANKDRLVRQ